MNREEYFFVRDSLPSVVGTSSSDGITLVAKVAGEGVTRETQTGFALYKIVNVWGK